MTVLPNRVAALAIAATLLSAQTRTPKGDLSKLGPQTRKDILALYSEDGVERANAAYSLGQARAAAAVPYLAGLLGDTEKVQPEYKSGYLKGLMAPMRVGEVAGQALGDMGATSALLRALRDPSDEIGLDALCGLVWPSSTERARIVTPLLNDKDPVVRRRAAEVLNTLGANSVSLGPAVPALVAALKDPVAEVRAAAASALQGVKDPRAAAALPLLAKDSDPEVRRSAIEAASEQKGEAATAAIVAALSDPEVEVRRAAAFALEDREAPKAGESLLKLVSDPDMQVRRNAIRALGRQKETRAVDPLLSALKDGNMFVREAAAISLGDIGDARAIPGLVELARHNSQDARAAARALMGFGPAGVEMMLKALAGDDAELRRNVAWEGGRDLKDARWLPAVLDAFRFGDADATLRGGLLGIRSPEPFVGGLRSDNARVRAAAAWALGENTIRSGVPALIAALEDPEAEVRKEAAGALNEISGRELGEDAARWKAWWSASQSPGAAKKAARK